MSVCSGSSSKTEMKSASTSTSGVRPTPPLTHSTSSTPTPTPSNAISTSEIDLNILPQNSWKSVKDAFYSDISAEFTSFKLKHGDIAVPSLLCLVQTIIYMWRIIILSISDVPFWYKMTMYFRMIVPVLGWSYVILLWKFKTSNFEMSDGKKVILFGNVTIIAQALGSGFMILVWALTRDDCHAVACREHAPDQMIPLGYLFHQIIAGVAMPLCFTCHNVTATIFSIVVTYTFMGVSAFLLDMSSMDILSIALMGFCVLFVLMSCETKVYFNFATFSKFEAAFRARMGLENEEYLRKVQAEDMRHVIGNVAHDLRTPLQAFQSELEFLRENIKSRLGEKGNSLLRSVKLMERISSFMNMTINRSIDFSKASAGIKIYPSIESIDFSDTLKMSIRCLVHSHTDVPIIIASISENISNHLFTDKQWLMENLLCLLSNAQKFTNEGEIRIRCSLMSNEATKGINEYTSGVEKDIEIGGGSELKSDELEFSMLRIVVEDTGIGTVKENRQQLFTPFAMVGRNTGGTGLGLYCLSKRLESLGGSCGVDDREDGERGSCFWFCIPYRPDDNVEDNDSVRSAVCKEDREKKLSRSFRDLTGRIGDKLDSFCESDASGNSKISNASVSKIMTEFINHIVSYDSESDADSDDVEEHVHHVDCANMIDLLTLEGNDGLHAIAHGNDAGHGEAATDVSGIQTKASNVDILTTSTKSPLRILLVDDSVMIRKSVSRALTREGHIVALAQDGVDCLKVLESSDTLFDLVLTDLQMPVMGGLELAKNIRAKESLMNCDEDGSVLKTSAVKIVGFSAASSVEEAEAECMACGMNGFMEKPLRMLPFQEYLRLKIFTDLHE